MPRQNPKDLPEGYVVTPKQEKMTKHFKTLKEAQDYGEELMKNPSVITYSIARSGGGSTK